jgi:primosomal protein N' (replication factor Y)
VPSAVAWRHLGDGRLTLVRAESELIEATRPRVLLATGELEARARISRAGMSVLRQSLEAGGYGVVLAARRGEGRALVCSRCGDVVRCTSCAAAVARTDQGGWWCVTCGARSQRAPACVRCGPGALSPLAAGAQRLGEELSRSLDGRVVVLEGYAQDVPPPPAILVMTRGSVLDRPPPLGRVHAVVLPDLDGALRRPVLDAAEDALRLAFAVAGWPVSHPAASQDAGSSGIDTAGGVQVVVETREPDHHAMRALKAWDPALFWVEESALRAAVRLPPHTHAIRLEHHGGRGSVAGGLTARLREALAPGDDLVGPLPLAEGSVAYLVRSVDRLATLGALRPLREEFSRAGVDLRLDVDPVDLG